MANPAAKRQQTPLWRSLAVGVLVSAILAFALLCIFAHLAEGHGWWIADHHLTSAQRYDVVRSTIASMGVFGIGAAALLAYCRRQTSKAMEPISHATQQASTDQHQLEHGQHQLEHAQHQLELGQHQLSAQLHDDSSTADLRACFATAAGQLGHESAAVRLAGVYAMAALADDWHTANDDIQMQVCIDVLCAYLRLPYDPDSTKAGDGERQVRLTVISIIRDHLQDPTAPTTWCGRNLDFTDATFDGGNFTGAQFTGGTVTFTGAQFTDGTVTFAITTFSGATVDFRSAEFSGGYVTFRGAKFSGGYVTFDTATFSGGTLTFLVAAFSGGTVTFRWAEFTGATVDFARPRDWNPGPTVDWTDTAPDGVTPTQWPPTPAT
ncbi:MAG: pentapeptide repeat-containing protein [Mycobacteriaceae bacterium]